jgi:hypothetical protein
VGYRLAIIHCQPSNNNRQIPIALYSELYFRSKTGLNELVQASQADKGAALVTALRKLARIQKNAQ